jgi:hypothetical protein
VVALVVVRGDSYCGSGLLHIAPNSWTLTDVYQCVLKAGTSCWPLLWGDKTEFLRQHIRESPSYKIELGYSLSHIF